MLSLPALLGVAHGSRNADSAAVTEEVMRAAGNLLGVEAHAAYLEDFATPSICDAARMLAAHGYSRAVAVPLLFTRAYHATEDAPEALDAAGREHGLRLTYAQVLGTGDDLTEVLAAHLEEYDPPPRTTPILLLAVGSSRSGANEAVQSLGERLAARTERPVHVRFATCAPRATEFWENCPAGPAGTLLPLFTAPGLLLDKNTRIAQDAGWRTLPHLGVSLAPLIAARYRAALESEPESTPEGECAREY